MIVTLMMILNMMMTFSLTLMMMMTQSLMMMISLKKAWMKALIVIAATTVMKSMLLWWRTLMIINWLMLMGLGGQCGWTAMWMRLMSLGRWYESIKCFVMRTSASELWRTPRIESGMSWPWRFTYDIIKMWIISLNCL